MAREQEIPKGSADLVADLLQSLQVLRDACAGLSSGGRHNALPLSGQLRALLLERSRRALPLLPALTTELGLNPTIWVMPGAGDILPPGVPKPIMHLAGFPFSLDQRLPAQVELALTDLGDHKLIERDEESYSLRQVVEYYANKAGGAHFSKTVPPGLASILSTEVGDMLSMRDAVLNALMQIGQAVYAVGVDSVRRLTNFDAFFDVGVVDVGSRAVLLDALYPGSLMRLSVIVTDKRILEVRAAGIGGAVVGARLERVVDWSQPHVIHVSLRHDDSLQARLDVALDDGSIAASGLSQVPIFLSSALEQYDVCVNRLADGELGDSSIALAQWALLGFASDLDVARGFARFAHTSEPVERKTVHYHQESFGRAAPGARDLRNEGRVILSRMDCAMNTAADE